MLLYLADENFNGDILHGLLHGQSAVDIVRVQDVGLEGADDPTILEWAAANQRILLTHDQATMVDHAFARVVAGRPMPGVIIVLPRMSNSEAIREIADLDQIAAPDDYVDRVTYLPAY